MLLKEQLNNRHKYIGGSDVPIIMCRSKFKTPFELLLEKAQIRESKFSGNIYSEVGNILESRIQSGMNLVNVDEITYKKKYNDVKFECHIDGLNQEKNQIQEIKVSGMSINQCFIAYEWQIRAYMYVVGMQEARLILLKREKELKSIVDNMILGYGLDKLHSFDDLSDESVEDLKGNLQFHLDKMNLSTSMLTLATVKRDEKKEFEMLQKIELFWKYKCELEENNALCEDLVFIKKFNSDFCDQTF